MKALFIGGTGLISSAVTTLALALHWELVLLNRGTNSKAALNARVIVADINDEAAVKAAIGNETFDVVADFIAFKPEHVQRDIRLFAGKCAQYILVSSCAVYERPLRSPYITESSPLGNRFWQYGRDKRECEETAMQAWREQKFPVTIVRPSLTYGKTLIPFAMNSWAKPWTVAARMLAGKPILVQGDGTSLWTMTHNTDFAKGFIGLMNRPAAIGEAYHITSDELLTWDDIALSIGNALNVTPTLVHMTSHQIARFMPGLEGTLLGDKSTSCIMDNSKIKRMVPAFVASVPFSVGVRRAADYFLANPELCVIDEEYDNMLDCMIAAEATFHP